MEKSSKEFNIEIGVHHLEISYERNFDGERHFYYVKKDNAPSEALYTEELIENLSEEEIVELYESQNEILQ